MHKGLAIPIRLIFTARVSETYPYACTSGAKSAGPAFLLSPAWFCSGKDRGLVLADTDSLRICLSVNLSGQTEKKSGRSDR